MSSSHSEQRVFGCLWLDERDARAPLADDPIAVLTRGDDLRGSWRDPPTALLERLLGLGFSARLPDLEGFPDLMALAGLSRVHHFRSPGFSGKKMTATLARLRHDPLPALLEVGKAEAGPVLTSVATALGARTAWLWTDTASRVIGGRLDHLADLILPRQPQRLALLVLPIAVGHRELVAELVEEVIGDGAPSDRARRLADLLDLKKAEAYAIIRGEDAAQTALVSSRFRVRGHAALRASHDKTLEFKREAALGPRETCVVGVAGDWDVGAIKQLSGRVRVTVTCEDHREGFDAEICPWFDCRDRIVFRKSARKNAVTLGCRAGKGASDLDRGLIEAARNPETILEVAIATVPRGEAC